MPKKRRGPVKHHLIDRLKKAAIEHHKQVRRYRKKAARADMESLNHAVKCGEALNKLRWETDNWRRGKWKKWLAENTGIHYESVKVYLRIYRAWDKPYMVKARKEGRVKSIKTALDVIKNRTPDGKKKPLKFSQVEASMRRQEVRERIRDWLLTKSREELVVLERQIERYLKMWDEQLYDDTCTYLECDLDLWLYKKVEKKLRQWERKNEESNKLYWNPPQWVIDAKMRELRIEQRIQDKKEAREKCVRALNSKRKKSA